MRIALLSPGYAPTPGGVESVVTALATGLVRRGAQVEVWAHVAADAGPGVESRDGVLVRRFPVLGSGRFPLSPRLQRYTASHGRDVDLVHAHSFHTTAATGVLLLPKSVPVVFTPHYHGGGHTFAARMLHPIYRPVGRRLMNRADRLITVSDAERALVTAHFPTTDHKIDIVHNAVAVDALHRAQAWSDTPATALVLGRLEPYKRVDLVIDAFARSGAAGQLVVIGDGPDRARITALAAKSSRAVDIKILGAVGRDHVDRWLRTANCVVSMSEHEAFGIVGLEGVAAGARALLSDLPAHRAVVELAGDDACISGPHTLAADIAVALATPQHDLRDVRDWSAVVDEHLAIYADVLRHWADPHQQR